MRSPITTHVLDVSRGKPAAKLSVKLEQQASDGKWNELARGATNDDGRVETLLKPGSPIGVGNFRLIFETGEYFKFHGNATFYPQVSIHFQVANPTEHYHVPLLVSPFGYSTYRGT